MDFVKKGAPQYDGFVHGFETQALLDKLGQLACWKSTDHGSEIDEEGGRH
jgi:hypothetical protein